MKSPTWLGGSLRWASALLATGLFYAGLYWSLFLVPNREQPSSPSTGKQVEIQYLDGDMADRSEVLQQRLLLYDPRPLLLPTEWNAANTSRLGDILQEEEDIFSDFAPMFELEDGNYLDDFGNVPANYEQLSVAQAEFDFRIFGQLGSRPLETPTFAREPGVEVVITDLGSGRELRRESIYNNVAERLSKEWPSWEPALLLGTVQDSFLAGGFTVLRSSGFDEADLLLRELAGSVLPVWAALENGPYLVEIAP